MTDRRPITKNQRRYIASVVETYCPPCEWCNVEIVSDDDWVIDHRVPCVAITALGLHDEHWPYLIADIVNLQPMHRRCNYDKGHQIKDADVRELQDAWDDACLGQSMLYTRILQAIIDDARRARQQANLERQLPLFG